MAAAVESSRLPEIRVPALWTFLGLLAGLIGGAVLGDTMLGEQVSAIATPLGTLWLRGLQMAIVPLVSALLFTGITRTVAAARAGPIARRTLGWFAVILVASGAMSAIVTPALLDMSPIPAGAVRALSLAPAGAAGTIPGAGDFLNSIVPDNVVDAAAKGALLPLVLFMALFALAATRLDENSRRHLTTLFEALAGAMLVVIGWVLALAPVGVFALAFSVAAKSGTAAIATLAHYIVIVSLVGLLVVLSAYLLVLVAAKVRLSGFARSVLPAQAVAVSTQSSLASLPAMLAVTRTLQLREASADFVLPLAVALFRATSPAMNIAVAVYVAKLSGVALTPGVLAAGVAVALLSSTGAPSLPGTISYIANIGPIALAMGVPIGPLALLVAVEMLPDIVRTLGNVTMDVAVATVVDRSSDDNSE